MTQNQPNQPEHRQTRIIMAVDDQVAAAELMFAMQEVWEDKKRGIDPTLEDIRRLMVMSQMAYSHQRHVQRQIINGDFSTNCDQP